MPEIGEVARIVHYLHKHVVGQTIRAVRTQDDDIIYGKVGTTATAFAAALTGKKVLDARQQGKYFWLVMSAPPHPLMHFGMSGWLKFSNDDTAFYKPVAKEAAAAEWPPKYWKFVLEMETGAAEKCEAAFVDPRRLGRIRLVDVAAEQLRKTSPLKENGPDPVVDRDILTEEWLVRKMRNKKVPVKALLLDQANISGVGNWVGDEVLYQARIHPEQYSNTFSDEQIKALHDALISVCTTAVETFADSSKFPEDWLMKHRWGKGKKDANKLPNGAKIVHLKVGGRTSAVVPSVQKKTGEVAADVKNEDADDDDADDGAAAEEEEKPPRKKRAPKAKPEPKATAANGAAATKGTKRGRGAAQAQAKEEGENGDVRLDVAPKEEEDGEPVPEQEEDAPPAAKRARKGGAPVKKNGDVAAAKVPAKKGGKEAAAAKDAKEPEGGRRRSLRNR